MNIVYVNTLWGYCSNYNTQKTLGLTVTLTWQFQCQECCFKDK